MKKFLLPGLMLFFFIAESIFVELFPADIFGGDYILVPRFLMVLILFFTIYGDKKQGIIYGAIFGILFDIVYTEVLGIYLFMFPLVSYIVSNIMKILQANIVVATFASLVGVALLELGVYEMNFLIKVTNMDFYTYLQIRLVPTLILNLVFTVVLAFPLKRLFEKYALQLKSE